MIDGLVARMRSLWRGVFRRRAADAELQDEFALHMELRAADLVKTGVSPAEAARMARAEFGGTFDKTQEVRDARGLAWFDALRFSALDFKLGARMLKRYPGLTIVGSLSMGVAIAVGAAVLTGISVMTDPRLPLPEGERIVDIHVLNTKTRRFDRRLIHQYEQWKSEISSVSEFAAYRGAYRNVITSDGKAAPARAVAMTASGFRIARVAPMLGRYFVDEDEQLGAAPVAVLSHEMWESRFASDSSVVGRSVMLGPGMHTIVGVMPPGFKFPVNYTLWVPFTRSNPGDFDVGEGPSFFVFGRLAPGATLDELQTQLTAIGARNAKQVPATYENLKPSAIHFAQMWFDVESPDFAMAANTARLMIGLLLALICSNIATLVYARTATRQREIAVRTALGASRARIVTQLFGEALLLAVVGAAIGIGAVSIVAAQIDTQLVRMGLEGIPYWVKLDVSWATVRQVSLLALAGAAIVGILPALQVTGRGVQRGLQNLATSQSSLRLGGTWTVLIVAQIAVTVAVLPTTVFFSKIWLRSLSTDPGFAAGQVLSAVVSMDREMVDRRQSPAGPVAGTMQTEDAFLSRFDGARSELLRRVREDAGVRAATFASEPAGTEVYERWELDTAVFADDSRDPFSSELSVRARFARVDAEYFRAFEVPLIAGRSLTSVDADSGANAVVVNRSFVASVLHGRNAVGRRIRSLTWVNGREPERGRWLEIVGVVGDFPSVVDLDRPTAAVYRMATPAMLFPGALHVRTVAHDAAQYTDKLRATAAAVNPSLQLRSVQSMEDVIRDASLALRLVTLGLVIVTLSVVILSAAGIYSLMSVVVTQRRREIGIRLALGADRRQVLMSVFKRAIGQLSIGGAVGLLIAVAVRAYGGGALTMMVTVTLLTVGLGLVAALGPARRALRIEPTEVLKDA